MNELVNTIKKECDPLLDFNFLFSRISENRKGNFIGGCGDVRTKHEKIFSLLYPNLLKQVSFGSGKGGYEKYTFKRVIVDFYDEDKKIAIEIDGESHNSYYRKLKDRMKELMLYEQYGIKTIRISNKKVEKMLEERVVKLFASWYWKS